VLVPEVIIIPLVWITAENHLSVRQKFLYQRRLYHLWNLYPAIAEHISIISSFTIQLVVAAQSGQDVITIISDNLISEMCQLHFQY
jgi:hypothetical protein